MPTSWNLQDDGSSCMFCKFRSKINVFIQKMSHFVPQNHQISTDFEDKITFICQFLISKDASLDWKLKTLKKYRFSYQAKHQISGRGNHLYYLDQITAFGLFLHVELKITCSKRSVNVDFSEAEHSRTNFHLIVL